jgi:NAD(P)H-flavin reductase
MAVDVGRLRETWARVASHGDQVPSYFYGHLFLTHPEVRSMFPATMAMQRDRLVGALAQIVTSVDDLDTLVPFLRGLGSDHRRFAVVADHYPAVGGSLLATLEAFLGSEWTAEVAADWTEAYGLVAQVMVQAAAEAVGPASWAADIVGYERRTADVAVLHVRPERPVPYQPGQSLSVEFSAALPRLWRFYSPANAPREDGLIELHVRAVDGGLVSSALTYQARVGDQLRLGPPLGDRLLLSAAKPGVPLVLIGGGTGLAPLKALLDGLVRRGGSSEPVWLVHGVRYGPDHYDLTALSALADRNPWLSVAPVVSDDPLWRGPSGTAVDEVLRARPGLNAEVFVCGSPQMITGSVARLTDYGFATEQIHFEHWWAAAVRPPAAWEAGT